MRLSDYDIARIRALRLFGWKLDAIALEYGRNRSHIIRVLAELPITLRETPLPPYYPLHKRTTTSPRVRRVGWWETWLVFADGRAEP